MLKFRKVWTKEIDNWLIENRNINRSELYQMFLEKFKIDDVTFTAFCNERSRVGAVSYHAKHGSTLSKPLGFESQKHGYIRVKIAQPNVWIYKQNLIWNQHHPDDTVQKYTEMVIFLNGDKRDFRIENLYKIPRAIATLFNQAGGVVKDNPAMTVTHIKQAMVKHEIFNRARELGIIRSNGRFLEDSREYVKKKNEALTPEEKEAERQRRNKLARERREKLKLENPEAFQEKLKKERERRKKFKLEHPEIHQANLRKLREKRRMKNDTRKN